MEQQFCPIQDKSMAPWAPELPSACIITAGQLWAAILDPECKTKGRMIAVLTAYINNVGMLGNECPQEVRDKINRMIG